MKIIFAFVFVSCTALSRGPIPSWEPGSVCGPVRRIPCPRLVALPFVPPWLLDPHESCIVNRAQLAEHDPLAEYATHDAGEPLPVVLHTPIKPPRFFIQVAKKME